MWSTALIFSNKNHDLQKKKINRKKLWKKYWITCCTHTISHAIWVDEITGNDIDNKD